MYYVKVKEDGKFHFPYSLYDLRMEFPNTSFNILTLVELDQDFLKENKIYPVVVKDPPAYDTMTENLSSLYIVYESDVDTYYGMYDVLPLSDEEKLFRLNDAKIGVTLKRNELLRDSDWTMLPDVEVDKEAWVEYRKQLRAISEQEGFPINITWPVPPSI
jgi:hypothetical protein